jgi:hypothetical protein
MSAIPVDRSGIRAGQDLAGIQQLIPLSTQRLPELGHARFWPMCHPRVYVPIIHVSLRSVVHPAFGGILLLAGDKISGDINFRKKAARVITLNNNKRRRLVFLIVSSHWLIGRVNVDIIVEE